jgi:HSP20 family protein
MPLFKTTTPPPADALDIPLVQPDAWVQEAAEGELAVDVVETEKHFEVISTVAGVLPDNLTLSIQHDLLTIRGVRERPVSPTIPKMHNTSQLVEECFWGRFSRSILLPDEIDPPRARAALRHGVLHVILPKRIERTHINIEHSE